MSATFFSRARTAIEHEYSAPIAIGTGVLVALCWSALDSTNYRTVIGSEWTSGLLQRISLDSTHSVVVNGLMTLFFFAIGLELSRELRIGELTKVSRAVAPVLGALGGMIGTAALSILIGSIVHSSALRRGWGVPMATDIAFTLGVLALAGRRLPSHVRIFLLTLAVADDAFSVIVLAFTGATQVRSFGIGALVVALVVGVLVSRKFQHPAVSVVLLVVFWSCFVWANIEPPLAGVLGGLLVSFRHEGSLRLEGVMNRWSTAIVLPLFAVVSCGVRWHALAWRHGSLTIVLSVIVIRILGKVTGISAGVAVARLLRFRLHPSITWPLLLSVSVLCAIGFTVPLLFASELFGVKGSIYGAYTVGLLSASLVATLLGVTLLRWQNRRSEH